MAAAGTHTTPTKYHAGEGRERAGKSAVEDLQQASAEIGTARREAAADARRSLASTPEGMRDVSGELCQRAEDQTGEWQDALERSSDMARRRMGRRGIRAQYTPEVLKGLLDESRKSRRSNWVRRRARGDGGKS
jgi:hypothetical protein